MLCNILRIVYISLKLSNFYSLKHFIHIVGRFGWYMDKIGYIPYYSYNVVSKGENKTNSPNIFDTENRAQGPNQEYMTTQVSSASRAYGLSFVNHNKTIPQMSLSNMVDWLESQGKIIEDDFNIDLLGRGNALLRLKNKLGEDELVVHYEDGTNAPWSCYELTEYKNGKPRQVTYRNKYNKINMTTKIFDKNDPIVEKFVNENISYNTTPQEYEQYLKDNNIKYNIEYSGEEDNNRSIFIDIFDENEKRTDGLWFYFGNHKFDEHCQWLARSNYDKNDKEIRRIEFNPNTTEVTTYLNYLH